MLNSPRFDRSRQLQAREVRLCSSGSSCGTGSSAVKEGDALAAVDPKDALLLRLEDVAPRPLVKARRRRAVLVEEPVDVSADLARHARDAVREHLGLVDRVLLEHEAVAQAPALCLSEGAQLLVRRAERSFGRERVVRVVRQEREGVDAAIGLDAPPHVAEEGRERDVGERLRDVELDGADEARLLLPVDWEGSTSALYSGGAGSSVGAKDAGQRDWREWRRRGMEEGVRAKEGEDARGTLPRSCTNETTCEDVSRIVSVCEREIISHGELRLNEREASAPRQSCPRSHRRQSRAS